MRGRTEHGGEANIHDGVFVVVEEAAGLPAGTVVLALLEGDEVTVKSLFRKNSHMFLAAEGPDHEDIEEVGWGKVEVQGRVMYVIHTTS